MPYEEECQALLEAANRCRAFPAACFMPPADAPNLNSDLAALRHAELHRGGLMLAAEFGVDQLLEDLCRVQQAWVREREPAWDELWLVGLLPLQLRPLYTPLFVRKFLVAWIEVGHKLSAPTWSYCSTVAEELALSLHKKLALVQLEGAGVADGNYSLFDELAYEDVGHEAWFDPALDGSEASPAAGLHGMTPLRFRFWFVPFNDSDRFAHPYASDKRPDEE